MSLQTRLDALITAIGADIKALKSKEREYVRVLPTDFSTTSTVGVDQTDLAFTPVAGVYRVELVLNYTTAAGTTAALFSLKWPTGAGNSGAVCWIINETSSAGTRFNQSSSGSVSNGTAGGGATVRQALGIGLIIVGTPNADIVPTIESEVGASAVTLKAGSLLRYQKIA